MPFLRRTSIPGAAVVLLAVSISIPGAGAQSVKPNRYSQPPVPLTQASTPDSPLGRQREADERARQQQDEAVRRAEQNRYAVALDANRRQLDADRARTDRLRAKADPAESERLRQEFEARRQASEREREALERARAQSQRPH